MSSGAKVHPDRFWLGEILDRCRAVLAAEAGVALATPWQPHIGITIGVDPDGAGAGALGKTLGPDHVPAPDTRGEAIGRAVGDPQGIGLVLELDDADDGSED